MSKLTEWWNNSSKSRKKVAILCATSIILMLINVIGVFRYYESLKKVYKIFTALPIIILFLYITNVLKTSSKTIKITIFAVIAGQYLFVIAGQYLFVLIHHFYFDFFDFWYYIIIFLLFLVAIWCEWKKYSKLAWKIAPICVNLILYSIYFIQTLTRMGADLGYFLWAVGDIAQILFCIALLIFVLLTDLPNKNIEKLPAKRALEVLKMQLDEGIIREDEYQAKRAEIIKKL